MSPASNATAFVFCVLASGGGAFERQVELVKQMNRRDFPTVIIGWKDPAMERVKSLESVTVYEIDDRNQKRRGLYFARRAFYTIMELDLDAYDTVWLGGFDGHAALGPVWAKRAHSSSLRVFTLLRGVELKLTRDFSKLNRLKRLVKITGQRFLIISALSGADLLLAQTPIGLEQLHEQYGPVLPEHTGVLPNNVNTSNIREQTSPYELGAWKARGATRDTRRDNTPFRIGFVGNVDIPVKGLDTLFQAADALRDLDVHFDIVGGGPDLETLQDRCRDSPLSEMVTFHGWQSEPIEFMARADLMIVPSRVDACPNVVLESLAARTPVLGSNVDGIPYLLDDDLLLFEPDDPEELAAKIRAAVEDTSRYDEYAERCAERAERFRFNWGETFLELLSQVDNEGGGTVAPSRYVPFE